LLAVSFGGSTVGTRPSAVIARGPSIIRRRLAAGPAEFGLVFGQRVADRRADVACGGVTVACFGGAVAHVGALVSLVAVVPCGHGCQSISALTVGERVGATCGLCASELGVPACADTTAGSISSVPSASWTIAARAENVAFLRQDVLDFVAHHGVAEPTLTDVRLAVSEAVTNAVVHAFRDQSEPGTVNVLVHVTANAPQIEVMVRDDGSGMAPRDDSPGLGLGLPLIRHLTDQFDHHAPAHGGTELVMRFRLPPAHGTTAQA
jgi:serine/threonine-protein kinase RsbW